MKTNKIIEMIVDGLTDLQTVDEVRLVLNEDHELNVPMELIKDVNEVIKSDLNTLEEYFGDMWEDVISSHVFDKIYEFYYIELDAIANKYTMNISYDIN